MVRTGRILGFLQVFIADSCGKIGFNIFICPSAGVRGLLTKCTFPAQKVLPSIEVSNSLSLRS